MVSDLSQKLKVARARTKLTQQDVAERLGVTSQAVSSYESGANPNAEILMKLAGIYNESVDYWLGLSREDAMVVHGLDEEEKAVLWVVADLLKSRRNEQL